MIAGSAAAQRERAGQLQTMGAVSASYNASMFGDLRPRLTNAATRLADMDRMGVALQVVSPSPTQYNYWADAGLAQEICAAQNEDVANLCRSAPTRFVGLGTVALQHCETVVRQLESVSALGLKGVQISTRIGERELSDPAHTGFWEAADRKGVVVFIHPYGCTLGDRIAPWYLSNILGQPMETTVALAGLALSGTLERFPKLKLFAAHGGGYLAAQSGRLDHGWHVRPEARTTRVPPSELLSRIFYDSLLHSPRQLGQLAAAVGTDRVMLGSDYPFDMGAYEAAALINAAGFDSQARRAIAAGNAIRFFELQELESCAA